MASPGADPCDWIDDAVRSDPERTFVRTTSGRSLTYAELDRQIARMAVSLGALGVKPGDRVAARVDKSVDAVVLYLACLRSAAVFVPINVASAPPEVEYFLGDSQPRLLVMRPEDRGSLEAPAARAGVRRLETLDTTGGGSLSGLAQGCAVPAGTVADRRREAPAAIIYTSGTTGRSKGAVLTRGNLASNAAALVDAWAFSAHDVLLHTLPLFHVHGLFAALNTVLAAGASLVLSPAFDAKAVIAGLPEATVYMGVPTHYTRLLLEPALTPAATRGMRLFVSGSAPLLADTLREFERRCGHVILERYGMTETLMITSNPYEGPRIPGSVGKPLPGISVRVRETDAAGAIGGIEVRGPNVFAGYWRDEAKTRAEFTEDGWFSTGDLGRIDAAGYLYIVGRAKDLVITGGYNVYPKEVEGQIDEIAGVLESAVFGVPHPDYGEGVTAAIVREPGSDLSAAGVIEALRSRLAAYKIPKRVVFVEELPRNAMGKVQKNLLRAAHSALYGEP